MTKRPLFLAALVLGELACAGAGLVAALLWLWMLPGFGMKNSVLDWVTLALVFGLPPAAVVGMVAAAVLAWRGRRRAALMTLAPIVVAGAALLVVVAR